MTTVRVGELRDRAAKVLDAAELKEVFTTRVDFKAVELPTSGNFDVSSNLIVRGTRVTLSSIRAWSQYELRAAPTGESHVDGWEMLVEVIATYEVDWELAADDLDLDAFALIVGAPLLHPYARAAIQSVTAASPYPAFTLGHLTPLSAFPDEGEVELDRPGDADIPRSVASVRAAAASMSG